MRCCRELWFAVGTPGLEPRQTGVEAILNRMCWINRLLGGIYILIFLNPSVPLKHLICVIGHRP
jgi:hypothetical protein